MAHGARGLVVLGVEFLDVRQRSIVDVILHRLHLTRDALVLLRVLIKLAGDMTVAARPAEPTPVLRVHGAQEFAGRHRLQQLHVFEHISRGLILAATDRGENRVHRRAAHGVLLKWIRWRTARARTTGAARTSGATRST